MFSGVLVVAKVLLCGFYGVLVFESVYLVGFIREPLLICGTSILNARLLFIFTFEIRDHRDFVYTMERQYLPHISQD